ncbi:MAG: AAA family ATPase [Deltaproteobacteria bacterium]|jgi:DNA-binding SARP family transcriptional activator|nr:AAA family ATPase [Deltaproteobacteria bacterium]MBW2498653.1 AAA family ATPase [Deltaproteobacteria bacterium]
MPTLQLRFLGDVEVLRGDERLALPPSKKTRALLAYLALTGRPSRRDHLCELLWELPDDPRGSLRWSLSKLRRLVDDAQHTRIVADRSQVEFDADGVEIDVVALKHLAGEALERASTEALEEAAARYQGNFLEGLELTQQPAFYAWCVSERDLVVSAQTRLLRTLIDRLIDEPDRALPYARGLVVRSPYDESLRADLIRLLVRSGRDDEAEQQYRMGTRMLKEIGASSQGLLAEARHETPLARPATAPRVSARRPALAVAQTTDLLVGRESETKRLQAGLEEVIELGRARLLLLQGEAGIGKSRLLEVAAELAASAGSYLLRASAFESETIRPFALWVDALRRLGSEAVTEVFGEGHRDDRDQLFGGLTELVERESRERPVVLVFDDLQWCDESSAAALHYVAHMNRDRPLFAVLAAREDELNDNAPVQQALRGLRRDRLLADLRVGPLSDDSIARIIAEYAAGSDARIRSSECHGNPLLAIELARSAPESEEGGSLQELVRDRLSRLDLDGADVLRWAALLAPRIDVPSLVRVTGLDASRVGEVLETAERMAILSPAERGFHFSHELVSRSIYNDIAPARRKVMHGRVAEVLEEDAAVDLDRAADLAHHASLSGDPALAARAMVFAGRLCLRFFANDDALSLVSRGLKSVEELAGVERVCRTLELRDVALAAAPVEDWEAAAKEYVALAEQALDLGALAHARLGYHMASYLRWMHGQWSHAREETLQAERVTRGASEEDHIIGMAETAKCLAMLERDLSQADAMLMEVEALAARNRMSHHAIPAAAGMLRFHRNELAGAEESFLEARTLCKSAGERVDEFQANEYLVMIDLERGRLESALERCAVLVEIGEKLREGSEAPFARALQGLCRYAIEDDDRGLEPALEELRLVDAKHRLACVLTRVALLDVERGRIERAIERASEALACAEVLERATDIVLAHVALAEALAAAGDASAAASHRKAIEQVDAASVAIWARDRARSLESVPA